MAKTESKTLLRKAATEKGLGPIALSLKELAGVLGVSYHHARALSLAARFAPSALVGAFSFLLAPLRSS